MPLLDEKKDRVRLSIIALAFFMATMLIQTNRSDIGTIIAFICLSSIILFAFAETGFRFKINSVGVPVLLFLLLIIIVTVTKTNQSFRLPRLILQLVACILLLNIKKVNKREEQLLIVVYIASTTVYSLLLLYSVLSQGTGAHRNIIFLGTDFDPNFIGLPFAFASALELYLLLYRKHGLTTFLALIFSYFSSVIIVVASASRGSAFSFASSNLIILFLFLIRKNKSVLRKIIVFALCIGAGYLMIVFFHDKFSNAFSRILTIGQRGSDNGRFELWRMGMQTWKENWLVGGGFYSNYQTYRKAVHNTYIEVLSETGIIGFALLCPFLFRAVQKCVTVNKYMFGALVALLIQIIFLDALDNRVLWVVFCWIAVLPSQSETQAENTD